MYKKTLLSVAIASTITLTGCLDQNNETTKTENDSAPITAPPASVGTYPVFDPATSALPIPNDLIIDQVNADGTYTVTPDPTNPAITALNELSGASTSAPIDLKISGLIDSSTLAGNVFLIALDYASGSPLQGLSISEPPTVSASQPSYTLEEKILDGTSYIRINPTSPLNPLTRYIAVITNGVKDDAGNALKGSPGATGYKTLTRTDDEQILPDPALAPVRALINGLWEPVAAKFFAAAVNPTRATAGLSALTDSNIVLSYSFMTSGDEKVLNYIADPAQWFNDQLDTFLGVKAATSIVTNQTDVDSDGDVDYTDVSLAKTGAVAAFPDAATQTALDGAGLTLAAVQSVPGCGAVTGGSAYISCMSAILGSPAGPFGALLPTPAASATVTFDDAGTLDAYQVSSLTASLMAGASVPMGTVSVTQGTISLPYYLGIPSGANGAPLITNSWEANNVLAGAINTAFAPLGLSIPQADTSVSTTVNYIFPFPKTTGADSGNVTIPILAIHPTTPAGPMKTVMFQHGIQTDRSAALTFGGSLVAGAKGLGADVAVIAIDQPLHGIGGINTTEQAALTEKLMTSAGSLTTPDGVFDGIDADEQTTIDAVVAGLFSAGLVQTIDTVTNSGAPGTTNCVDLGTNGLTATTNSILGGACDADPVIDGALGQDASAALFGAQVLERTIANGAGIVPGLVQGADSERHFGFTANATAGAAPNAMDYTGSSAANFSGSTFINLTSFLTSRDNLRQQVLDLLAVRKTVGSMDLNGAAANGDLDGNDVYFIGHSLGTINGMPFVTVANDSATTTDNIIAANMLTPGGGFTGLLENSPVFAPSILNGLAGLGLTQDTSSFQAFIHLLQATLDSADAINYVEDIKDTTPVLFSEVVGDTYIPNSVDTAGEVLGAGSISYSGGTEPLIVESSATAISDAAGNYPLTQNVVRYTEGFHTTPVFPATGTNEELTVYSEMVKQATSLVLSSGTAVTVDNSTIDVIQ